MSDSNLTQSDITYNFQNKSFVVAGASSGLGLQVARQLAESGASLVLLGRRTDAKLPTAVCDILSDRIRYFSVDMSLDDSEGTLKEIFSNFVTERGRFSGLVSTIGRHYFGPIASVNQKSIHEAVDVNIASIYNLVKTFSKKKIINSNASIVLSSSTAGYVGESCNSLYAMTKSAVGSLTRSFAAELLAKNIRVNSVVPAIVDDGMTEKLFSFLDEDSINTLKKKHPMGFGDSSKVASTILFLLAEESGWINGTNLICDGGYLAIRG